MPTDCTKYFTEFRHDPINFFLIAALTGKKALRVSENCKDGKHMVRLTINGIEVDVEHAIHRFVENFDEEVKKEAVKLLRKRFTSISEILSNLENDAVRKIEKDLGISHSEDE